MEFYDSSSRFNGACNCDYITCIRSYADSECTLYDYRYGYRWGYDIPGPGFGKWRNYLAIGYGHQQLDVQLDALSNGISNDKIKSHGPGRQYRSCRNRPCR